MPSISKPIRRPWQPERKAHGGRSFRDKRYDSVMWRKLRLSALKKHPLCARCHAENIIRQASVYDHIIPIRMIIAYRINPDPFWHSNHQGLCNECHNSKSGTEARYNDARRYFNEQLKDYEKNKTRWIIEAIEGGRV